LYRGKDGISQLKVVRWQLLQDADAGRASIAVLELSRDWSLGRRYTTAGGRKAIVVAEFDLRVLG